MYSNPIFDFNGRHLCKVQAFCAKRLLRYGVRGIVLLILLMVVLALPALPSVAQSPDRDALVALYNSTDGGNWLDNSGWLAGDHCMWYGITCESGQVVQLSLTNNQLNGPLPPELGQLADLETLVLFSNELSGSIPPELGQLSSLKHLLLGSNPLSGSIPAELGNLTNLEQIYIDRTQISGAIPPELGNLVSLIFAELSNNQLSGSIPPEFGELGDLITLVLENNQLSGPIPPELGNLANLDDLYLANNQLSGEVPLAFNALVNLSTLLLNDNSPDLCTPEALRNFVNSLASYASPPSGFCKTDSPSPNSIEIEAESGELHGGFTIGHHAMASGGAYIYVPDEVGNRGAQLDESQSVRYTFTLDKEGIYRISGKVRGPDVFSNSFYVKIDSTPTQGYTWHNQVGNGYATEYVTDGPNINMVERVLAAGDHTLTIYLRETGTELDAISIERIADIPVEPMPEGCDGLVREAEAGNWEGWFSVGADENASGGFYLHVPDGRGSRGAFPDSMQKASYCFTVDEPGMYRINAWVYADSLFNNSFFVSVNESNVPETASQEIVWHTAANTDYAPEYVTGSDVINGQPTHPVVEVKLDAGVHTVYFFLREDGTRLDKIALEPVMVAHYRAAGQRAAWPDGRSTFLPFMGQ